MPLSKARDRERKRLARLDKGRVQPELPADVQPTSNLNDRYEDGRIGIPKRPTQKQREEWARSKLNNFT